jgi:hypothetical protein
MAGGRPTDYTKTMGEEIPYSTDMLCGLKSKWKGVSETKWCAFAMERHHEWIASTGKTPFDSYELEHQVSLNGKGWRSTGLPRIDAVGWRNGKATIIEAKVEISPSSVMGGVGQLLYYKQIATSVLGWDVEDLILLTPSWPLFLVETIEANALPITLVMATPEMFYCKRAIGDQ